MVQEIVVVSKMVDKYSGAVREMTRVTKGFGSALTTTTTRIKGVTASGKKFDRTIRETTKGMRRFQMHLLSLMFFGMMLQRTFNKVMQSSVDAFMKISEGATLAGQGITALSAHWEYLKFAVGNAIATALLPFLPVITNIIEKIVDWVSENPKLVAAIVMIGLAAGTALLTFGQLGLGIMGVIMWVEKAGGALGILSGILKFGIVGAIIAAIVGFVFFREKTIETINNVIEFLRGVDWTGVWNKIVDAAHTIIGTITEVLNRMFEIISGWFEGVTWEDLWFKFFSGIETALGYVGTFLNKIWEAFMDWFTTTDWGEVWKKITRMTGTFLDALATFLVNIVNAIINWFSKLEPAKIWKGMLRFTGATLAAIARFMGQVIAAVFRFILNVDWIKLGISIGKFLLIGIIEILKALPGIIWGIIKNFFGGLAGGYFGRKRKYNIRKYQFGGYIPTEGLYHLHAGEYVVPKGETGGVNVGGISVTINTPGISSNVDINDLADRVSRKIVDDISIYANPTASKFRG